MASSIDPTLPAPDSSRGGAEVTLAGLDVNGTVPAGLSGTLLGIGPDSDVDGSAIEPLGTGDGVVHSIQVYAGRAVSYRSRWVRTDTVAKRLGVQPSPGPSPAGPDVVAGKIVGFGGSILAFGAGSLAYELSEILDTLRRVDLAGQSRGLSVDPEVDPATGDLHVVAVGPEGGQSHVVVPSDALTRRSRPIDLAPNPVKHLAATRDRVVFAADGFVGVTSLVGQVPITWIATGVDAPTLVHAHDIGATIVVLAVTPSLERWTLHAPSSAVDREVLDVTPRRFARIGNHLVDAAPRFVWTITDRTVDRHDLATGDRVHQGFGTRRPGDLVFVTDPRRASEADGGWLIGLVRNAPLGGTDLIVLDAADLTRAPIATVGIPVRIPRWLHTTWIPSTDQ